MIAEEQEHLIPDFLNPLQNRLAIGNSKDSGSGLFLKETTSSFLLSEVPAGNFISKENLLRLLKEGAIANEGELTIIRTWTEKKSTPLSSTLQVIYYYLWLKSTGARSSYLAKLPSEVDMPYCWGKETQERRLLDLCRAGDFEILEIKKERLEEEFKDFTKDLLAQKLLKQPVSFEDYSWSSHMMLSRSMELPSIEGSPEQLVVVPFIDFANHSASPNARWIMGTNGSMKLVLNMNEEPETLAAGTEITISYGDHLNNYQLLIAHGFSIVDNVNKGVCLPPPFKMFLEMFAEDDGGEEEADKVTLYKKMSITNDILDRQLLQTITPPAGATTNILPGDHLNPTNGCLSNTYLVCILIWAMEDLTEMPEDLNTPEAILTWLSSLPYYDILALRCFSIFLNCIEERIDQLIRSNEEEEWDQTNPKVKFVKIWRDGDADVLKSAYNLFSSLTEELAKSHVVQDFLNANN